MNAGYNPASKVTTTTQDIKKIETIGCVISSTRPCGMYSEKYLIAAWAQTMDSPTAKKQRRKLSHKNRLISMPRELPRTFLTPTSLARLEAWAVSRLIKLMEAMISKSAAISNRICKVDFYITDRL